MVELLKLRVVPELLYALQELDVLSGAPNLHRAATRVSQGRSSCDCHCVHTHRQREKSAEMRWVISRSNQYAENDKGMEGDRGSGQQVAERGAEDEAVEAQGWGMEETCYWAGRKGGAIEH